MSLKFFFDRCLSVHIARMIGNLDRLNNVVHQDDDGRFEPDSEDVHIIETLAAENPKPIWITGDRGQRRKPLERLALRDSQMTIFFFRQNFGDPDLQALKTVAIWPEVRRLAGSVRRPTAFEIPAGGIGQINKKVTNLGPTAELFGR